MERKICLITGANSGIGKASAIWPMLSLQNMIDLMF